MEDYASCRAAAGASEGAKDLPADLAHFGTYLASPARHAPIPVSMWAMKESMTVTASKSLYAKRVFPVPVEVSPEGRAYMGAHLLIGGVRPRAPRMHVLDDTGRSGLFVIGYLGPHLLTSTRV